MDTERIHVVIGAALASACMISGFIGGALGHPHVPSRREPHHAVVLEANEEITLAPLLAPEKFVAEETETDPPPAPALARSTTRRAGFGHMGSDRARRR